MYIYIYIIAIATAISYYILFFNIIAIMNYISWWHPASKNEKKKKKKKKNWRKNLTSPATWKNTVGIWSRLQSLSETEIIFLLTKRPTSSFRAACGQGGRAARGARAAGSKGRGSAPAQPPAAAGGPAARAAPAARRWPCGAPGTAFAQHQLKNLR